MEEILFGTIKFIGRVIFEIPFIYTGEILLYLLSFGRRKPRWDIYANDAASKFVIFTEVSFWLGAAFWVGVAAVVFKQIS
jgi:hypothetical protein